jgi:hypothetical protein
MQRALLTLALVSSALAKYSTLEQKVKEAGYKSEKHNVITDDGW